METKEKSKWSLSTKLLVLSLILLLIDFVFFKLFGETYKGDYSLGNSLFTAVSILTLLSFVGFWVAFIAEGISSCKKKHKKNKETENPT